MDGFIPSASPLSGVALFIDGPNICGFRDERNGASYQEVLWPKLISRMFASAEGGYLQWHAGFYAFTGKKEISLTRRLRQARGLEYLLGEYRESVSVRVENKDIDALIVNDMWWATTTLIGKQRALGREPPYAITILLASGDAIYAEPIESIRGVFGDTLNLSVHLFGRREYRSRILGGVSDRIYDLGEEYFDPKVFGRAGG